MSAAYCPKCSTLMSEQAQFCSVCGTFLSFQGEHPTMPVGPVNEEDFDTGATVLAEHTPVEGIPVVNASISSMVTERGVPSPEPVNKGLAENASAAVFLSVNDDTPTIPGMLSQFDQAARLPGTPPAQPAVVLRGQGFAETVGVPQMQPIVPDLPPLQSQLIPRHGTISARKPKSFFASSRYFFVGTGLLLLIGLIALVTYPYLVKGKMSAATATTSAYAQPALLTHSTMPAMAAPTATPVATPASTVAAAVNPVPTPTVSVAPACLQVSKHALKFSATSGGNAPDPQTITLTNTCTTGAWTVRWDVPWLSASPSYNGTVNGATPVVITVSNTNLAANSYPGHVTFSSGASQVKVTVTLTVAPPVSVQPTVMVQPTPTASAMTTCIKLDQSSLNFSAPPQQNPASQAIIVTNCGSDGTVTASVSNTYTSQSAPGKSRQHNNGTNWLTTSAGGKLAAGGTLPVHVNTSALGTGVYASSITITITTSDGKIDIHTVNVTFTVQGG